MLVAVNQGFFAGWRSSLASNSDDTSEAVLQRHVIGFFPCIFTLPTVASNGVPPEVSSQPPK